MGTVVIFLYYILRKSDFEPLFLLPYPLDFCYYCLFNLLERSDDRFYLMHVSLVAEAVSVQCVQSQRDKKM